MEQRQMKQFMFRLPVDLHAEVKARAALRGLSMAAYIERVLTEQVGKEKRYFDKVE